MKESDALATDPAPLVRRLEALAYDIRRTVLVQSKRAGVGHIGSALCLSEILAVLYGSVLRIPEPEDEERDRFLLGKGHAALALYAVLDWKGWLPPGELDTYCADATRLGVHPEHHLSGVDFSTGSLGQALGYGAGAAVAARLLGSPRRVYVLLSDAECNEGSLWEAAMFAAHHRLGNLVAVVDDNGQQALGKTRDVLCPSPLADRWRGFGWRVEEVDGHDVAALDRTFAGLESGAGAPTAVLARTVFGKGVSYMEGRVKWHYWPMSDEEYDEALQGLGARP